MNKTLLLAGVATALLTVSANATEFSPYVSAKAAYGFMRNTVNVGMHYSNGPRNYNYEKTHKDNVWGLRLAAGASTPVTHGKLRTELEFGWNDKAKDSKGEFVTKSGGAALPYDLGSKVTVFSTMINVYYDIDTGTKFTPYIGAGLGMAHLKDKATVSASLDSNSPFPLSDTEEENHLAWNLGFGMNYALTDNLSLDLGYRYSDYGRIKKARKFTFSQPRGTMSAAAKVKVTAHEALLGLRYAF